MSKSGFEVHSFSNGKELLESVSKLSSSEEPSVIVIDHHMPILNGLETAKLLRTIKPHLKIVLASAYQVPNESKGYYDKLLKKPFSKEELLDAISSIVQ